MGTEYKLVVQASSTVTKREKNIFETIHLTWLNSPQQPNVFGSR